MRVAGIGLRAQTRAADVAAALAGLRVDALACLAGKSAALVGLGLPVVQIAEVAGIATPSHSDRIMARFGTGCLAEAVALVAAGPGARIVQARRVFNGPLTLAIAEGSGE